MKIILIGFMGSGKSTISKLIGKILDLKVLDMDDMVEDMAGMKTPEIFDKFGEAKFREFESKVAENLSQVEDIVISTGGGVILNKLNIINLRKNNGRVVFLRTTFDEIVKRVSAHDRPRPLFSDIKKAVKLFESRKAIYKSHADIIIDTDGLKVEDIVNQLISG